MSSNPTDLINLSALAHAVALELQTTIKGIGHTRRILNLDEAAEYCGLTRDSFKKKVIRDQLRRIRIDKRWRIDRTDLDAWIESHKDQIAVEVAE